MLGNFSYYNPTKLYCSVSVSIKSPLPTASLTLKSK